MTKKIKIHSRNLSSEQISIRSDENGDRFIDGYAIVFNQESKLIRDWEGEYIEIIDSGAVDKVLRHADLNVIATVDHWRDKMLGRTKSGTLTLTKKDKGLMYSIKVPNTQLGNDIAELISRGDYFESSFIFTASRVEWDKTTDPNVRTVLEIDNLFDVSVVIDGAYANTAVALRSQEWESLQQNTPEEKQKTPLDILRKRAEILNLQ